MALAVASFLVLTSGSCGTGGKDTTSEALPVGRSELVPSFPPVEAGKAPAPSPATGDKTGHRAVPSPGPTSPPPNNSRVPDEPAYTPTATARIVDAAGDVDWKLERPPSYVDIVHAELTRSSAGFELRVGFGAGVPERQADEDRTMNVASFYDVTGDGQIDYEIWANLADNGWGPGYLDRREGRARFMDDSALRIGVKGAQLVIRFPLAHLDGAATLRWSVGSEWGSHEVISTPAAARDHAPNDGPAMFPG